MFMSDSPNETGLILFFLALLVIGGVVFWVMQGKPNTNIENPKSIDGWMTTTTGLVTFQYPETLNTKYISLSVWPPLVQVAEGPVPCVAVGGGVFDDTTVFRQKRTINGREYCVTTASEDAEGSVHWQYLYAFTPKNSTSTVTLAFSLRFPQCLNYDDPERTACQTEQSAFSIDQTIDQIAQTVTLP